VKLRPSSTPDIVHGSLSFRKELLGLKSEAPFRPPLAR
jgi:hypothetical protein